MPTPVCSEGEASISAPQLAGRRRWSRPVLRLTWRVPVCSSALLAAALLLVAAPASSEKDTSVKRVYTSHPSSPSQLYINEAVGDTRVVTLPNKNKLYELLLYPSKLVRNQNVKRVEVNNTSMPTNEEDLGIRDVALGKQTRK